MRLRHRYYGNWEERLYGRSRAGRDFLARVCTDWEAAAVPASGRGIRVVSARLGMVLSSSGGALGQMLPPFRLGAGGMLGSGSQYMSWISLDDVVGAITHVLTTDSLHGPVNFVAPGCKEPRVHANVGPSAAGPTASACPPSAARPVVRRNGPKALLLASIVWKPPQASAFSFRYRSRGRLGTCWASRLRTHSHMR